MEQPLNREKLRNSIARLGDPQQQVFFFQRLVNPNLFDTLKDMGEFSSPPPVRPQPNGGMWHPPWPQAIYLTNVAAQIPARVATVLASLRTKNHSVVLEILNAVLAMPTDVSKTLTTGLQQWIEADPEFLVYRYLDIIDRFAKSNEIDAAKKLSRMVLAVVAGPEKPDVFKRPWVEAIAKTGDSHYGFVIDRVSKSMLPVASLDILRILAHRLREAVEIEFANKDQELSYIWARDLEKEAIGFGAKEELTYHLFALALKAVQEGYTTLADVLELFGSFHLEIFTRIRIMLVVRAGDLEDARAMFAEPRFYSSRELQRERGLLLKKFYSSLNSGEQNAVLAAIRSNIISEPRLKRFYAGKLSGKDLLRTIKQVRDQDLFEELEPFGSHLTGSEAGEYEDLRSRFERREPGPKDGEVWHGPTSPKSLEDFQAMSTAEILSFLEEWKPKSGWFEPTPEGAGRTLKPVFESRIAELLGERARVQMLPPRYVYHIVDAIRLRVNDVGFDFDRYLDLLDYARLVDPAEVGARYAAWDEADEDEGLSSARQVIAFALSDMFKARAIPYHLRGRSWEILKAIVEDPDPTTEDDARYAGDSKFGQPWNLALNSARGAGMLAIFDYARWVKSCEADQTVDLISIAPEIFETLDRKLDPTQEPTRAIRSTIGQNFVSIFALSRLWTRPAIDSIFSNDPLGEAAWQAYLVYNNLYSEIYDCLKDRYAESVANVASAPVSDEGDWNPIAALGGHLMGPYAWGRVGLEKGSLIDSYLQNAPPAALEQTLRSIGSGLSSDLIAKETVRRFEALYEYLISMFESRQPEADSKALQMFGLWFISGKLDPDWALRNLLRTLRLTGGKIAIEIRVIEELAVMSAERPLAAIQALDAMMSGVFLFHFANQTTVRTILENAVKSDEVTRKAAVAFHDRLANWGVHDYFDIFKQ